MGNMFIDICHHDVAKEITKAAYNLNDARLANIAITGWQLIKVIAYFAFTGRNDVIKLFYPRYQFVGKFIGYMLKDVLLGALKRLISRVKELGKALDTVLR